MRNPNLMNEVEYNNDDIQIITMDNIPEYDIQDYDLFDDKDFKKYINDIEKIVRISFEYRQLIGYLRENMDFNKCSFYKNVNNINTFKIKIEIHHHPFTLYDLCIIVYNKRVFYHESLEVEMVAKEVMFLHYNMLVGLIPLAETVHELVHNQYLFIPMNYVMGKFNEFMKQYNEFIPIEVQDVFEKNIEFTNKYNENDEIEVLKRKYIYLDLTGSYNFPNITDVIQLMSNKINELKQSRSNTNLPPAIIFLDE